MTTEQKKEAVYTKDQIKDAIRREMAETGFMGEGKDRYYMIIGIVMAALERFDKRNVNPLNGAL